MKGTKPTTSLPCPSWCTLGAGHPFNREDVDGEHSRDHERYFGPHVSGLRVQVDVKQYETADGPDGPVISQERPAISAVGDGLEELTGPHARRVAAALLNAADLWDVEAR